MSLQTTMQEVEEAFAASSPYLHSLIPVFHSELITGLCVSDTQMLRALPTFVTRLPTGRESGCFLTIDLGGTNVRVGHVRLEGCGRWTLEVERAEIPEELKTGECRIFEHLADKVFEHLRKHQLHSLPQAVQPCSGAENGRQQGLGREKAEEELSLGFTFSYPVKQLSINHGILLQWNKAIDCPDVLGKDVVRLLQDALDARGLSFVRVRALINDTVGTFVAHAYADPRTRLAIVLGTGTNACYLEPTMGIVKLARRASMVERLTSSLERARQYDSEAEGMLINVEWGAFGDRREVREMDGERVRASPGLRTPLHLQWTRWDDELDAESANPGQQHFEKMVAGMYLGELATRVYRSLHPDDEALMQFMLDAKDCSDIEAGQRPAAIKAKYMDDLQSICRLVSNRSIALVSALTLAILTHIRRSSPFVVAIDGALYQHYHEYAGRMQDKVNHLAAECDFDADIQLVEAADQSSVGAAAGIAALFG